MRQIEAGDIHRTLLHTLSLPKEAEARPSHECIHSDLRLELPWQAENALISHLMGHLSYRNRQLIVRVVQRITRTGDGKFDLFRMWHDMATRHLEQRHTLFVKAESFEQWRRDMHDLDEDLPGITLLAAQNVNVRPTNNAVFEMFRHWHTFATGDDQQLASELAKGLACQHIHIGGAYPAPFFWIGLMNLRFRPDKLFPDDQPDDKNERALRYPYNAKPQELRDHVQRAILLRWQLWKIASAHLEEKASDEERGDALVQLKRILNTSDPKPLDGVDAPSAKHIKTCGGVDYAWPLGKRQDRVTCPSLLGERRMLYALLHMVATERERPTGSENARILARALWAYLQAKNLFLGTAQQREGIAGFDFFEYTLRQVSWWQDDEESRCAVEIGQFLQESRSVLKVELMTSPESTAEDYEYLFGIVQTIQKTMTERLSSALKSQHGRVRVGVVVHFIKNEGEELGKRITKDECAYLIYHHGVRDKARERANTLIKYIRGEDYIESRKNEGETDPLPEICGIDTANRELHCPPELFGPIYAMVASMQIGRTYHVGEDFLHMMTGLRRIYEAILFLCLRPGDRLGHCVALGMSPKLWVHGNPTVSMHRVDMLDDAVFEWTLLQEHGHGHGDPARLTQLERLIARHSMDIYGVPIDPHILQAAWRRRGEDFLRGAPKFGDETNIPSWIRLQGAIMKKVEGDKSRVGTHNIVPSINEINTVHEAYTANTTSISADPGGATKAALGPGDWPRNQAERILLEYLYDRHTIHREIEMEPVQTLPDLPHIRQVQDILRGMVMSKGITIESNPSSNWLIGGFERLYDVPAVQWALNHPSFPMTINPDDPATFSTSIENEYFFVFSSLLHGTDEVPGLSRLDALTRIRRIRELGLESSFLR